MMATPLLEANDDSVSAAVSIHDLRQMVSHRTHLVEKPSDRRVWNAWLQCPPPLAAADEEEECTPLVLSPGCQYRFVYRSNVDWEERQAFFRGFWTAHYFLAKRARTKKGINMLQTVSKDGETHVILTSLFRYKPFFQLRTHTFWGRVVVHNNTTTTRSDNQHQPQQQQQEQWIEWIEYSISTPRQQPKPTALQLEPWKVVKQVDGMLVLQSSAGMMAFEQIAEENNPQK